MALCNCPPGTTIDPNDPTKCIGIDEIPPTGNPTSLILKPGFKYTAHNSLGAVLFEDITNKSYPLGVTLSSLSATVDSLNVLVIQNQILQGDPWQTSYPLIPPFANDLQNGNSCGTAPPNNESGPAYGRLGAAGVLGWESQNIDNTVGCYYFGNNNYHGFQYCLDVPVTKQYVIGVAANNFCRFSIDGIKIFDQVGNSNTAYFKYLRLFPITLTTGTHVIKIEGADATAGGAWVIEIYNLDENQIQNITSVSELESSILFSTGDFIDQEVFTLDEYTCPPGYTLDVCDGTPKCVGELRVPFDCCYELIDCVTGSRFKTKSDFGQYVSQTVKYNFPNGGSTCYSVDVISCLCETPFPSPLAEAKSQDFIFLANGGSILTGPSTIGITVRIEVVNQTIITYTDGFGSKITVTLNAGSSTDIVMHSQTDSDLINNVDPAFPLGPLPQDAFIFETSEITGITLAGISECPDITEIDPAGVSATFNSCDDCLPKCYKFEDCSGVEPDLYFDDSAAPYVNKTVKSTDINGSICYEVTEYNCTGGEPDIGSLPIDDIYDDCPDCLNSLISYNLIPCDDTYLRPLLGIPKTEYDLEQYLGMVIRLNANSELLYNVELGSVINTGLIDIVQIDIIPQGCPACDPEQRFQEPNINFNCDIKTVLKTKCTFADSVYAMFKQIKFGIKTCCEFDLDKADMRNMLLDFRSLKDPELCNDLDVPSQECCPQPCFVTAMIQIPQWGGCEAPENVTANLNAT